MLGMSIIESVRDMIEKEMSISQWQKFFAYLSYDNNLPSKMNKEIG